MVVGLVKDGLVVRLVKDGLVVRLVVRLATIRGGMIHHRHHLRVHPYSSVN